MTASRLVRPVTTSPDEAPPSVLHVSQPGSEGVAIYVAGLAELQARTGYRVAVACPADTWLADAAARAGVEVRPWPAGRNPDIGLGRELRSLTSTVGRFDPDVVHLHSSKAGLVGRLAVRGGRPTVFQPHAWSFQALGGPLASLAAGWERLAGPWADVVVTVSNDELSTGLRRGVRARGRMVVVPNPVDTDRFRPETDDPAETAHVRRSLGLSDEPLAVCVGRLCHQKGQDRLVDGWPSVLERVPDACLLLVGDGPDRRALEAQAGERILFAGNRADVPAILRAAQVAVLPSRWEGMSLAVLEALATARPVVATEVAGVAETVGRGAGAIVAQHRTRALAAEVARRLADPCLARREGRVGRDIVLRSHGVTSVVDGVRDAYRHASAINRVTGRPAVPGPGVRADG